MLIRVVFWGAGCLQGIFPEGRVFTRDCFGGEGVYKVIFLEGRVFMY